MPESTFCTEETTENQPESAPTAWTPDGKSIAFTHTKTPKANDWTTADVSVVDVASGEVRTLAATAASEGRSL